MLGLTADLGLSSAAYSNSLAIFFAFYIASEGEQTVLTRDLQSQALTLPQLSPFKPGHETGVA